MEEKGKILENGIMESDSNITAGRCWGALVSLLPMSRMALFWCQTDAGVQEGHVYSTLHSECLGGKSSTPGLPVESPANPPSAVGQPPLPSRGAFKSEGTGGGGRPEF